MIDTNTSSAVEPTALAPARILALGFDGVEQLLELEPEAFEIVQTKDADEVMEELVSGGFDLIFLDDNLLQEAAEDVIREIKRRYPIISLCLLSESQDMVYQTGLIEVGIDDFIKRDVVAETLLRRTQLLLYKRRQSLVLARRNRQLHTITLLAQQLHLAETPRSLVTDALQLLTRFFGLYGVAIAIEDSDQHHIYAGTALMSEKGQAPYESRLMIPNYDPMAQVILSEMPRIFNNLKELAENGSYTSVPVLSDAQSALILPLKYGAQTLGALAVFSDKDMGFSHNDLAPYELLSSHFASAYYNVYHYYNQYLNVQITEQILRAWQRLTTLYRVTDVIETLSELVQEVPVIDQATIWLYDVRSLTDELIIHSTNKDSSKALQALSTEGNLKPLIDQFDARMQPQIFRSGRGRREPLQGLLKAMGGTQLMLVPLVGSSMLLGGMFVSVTTSQELASQDRNLMESLAHAAAQTIERNTFISEMEAQTGRLEAILHRIREGIFFVGDDGNVFFTNPQFSELTGVSPLQVRGEDQRVLLELLADCSPTPETTYAQLKSAIEQALTTSDSDDNHFPIVELHVKAREADVSIEVMKISQIGAEGSSWVGFIRDTHASSTARAGENRELLNSLIEDIGIPYTQLHHAIMTLREHHAILTDRKREQLLQQLEGDVEAAQRVWFNFAQIYKAELNGILLDRAIIDPAEMMEDILDSRRLSKHRRRIKVNVQPPHVQVDVDERSISQAVTNIIDYMMHVSNGNAPITIHIKPEAETVLIGLQDKGPGLSEEQASAIFDPLHQDALQGDHLEQLGMYLAHRLVTKHEGTIKVESRPGWGMFVQIVLPTVESNAVPIDTTSITREAQTTVSTLMVIEGSTHLLTSAYDLIEREGMELIVETNSGEAIRNLGLTQIHLILLEDKPTDQPVAEVLHQIRRESDVPIILISDEDSEQARIEALQNGADDYLKVPVSEQEFLTRIDTISKRRFIATRTQPPMQIGDVYIDFSQRRVYLRNKLIDLTAKEYELLRTLAQNKGQVLTHQQLLARVWGPEHRDETQYLWVNISRLRKKLEPDANSPRYIHTEQGTGYVFREP